VPDREDHQRGGTTDQPSTWVHPLLTQDRTSSFVISGYGQPLPSRQRRVQRPNRRPCSGRRMRLPRHGAEDAIRRPRGAGGSRRWPRPEPFWKASTRVRAPFSRRARGPGVPDRIVQEGDAFADDPTALSPVLVAQPGFRGGYRRWCAGERTRPTGHRRSMSAVHMPHKTCRWISDADPAPDAPPSRSRGACGPPGYPPSAVAASLRRLITAPARRRGRAAAPGGAPDDYKRNRCSVTGQ
jgi:hypothetical protein